MHKFTIGEYKNLNLRRQIDYTDEDLTAAANQAIIKTAMNWLKTNGSIEIGDTITVINQASLNGVIIPELTSSSLTYMVGDKSILAALNQAEGKKQGDIFDVTITIPGNSPIERIQNQAVDFHIEIKDVKHGGSQNITDELVRQINPQYKDLAAMQTDYKLLIADNAAEKATDNAYKQIIETIISNSSYELDNEEYLKTVEELKNSDKGIRKAYDIQKGFDPESNLQKYYKKCEDDAKHSILEALILQTIAEQENITITEEEFTDNKAAFTQTAADIESFKCIFPDDAAFRKFLLKEKVIYQLLEWNTAQ